MRRTSSSAQIVPPDNPKPIGSSLESWNTVEDTQEDSKGVIEKHERYSSLFKVRQPSFGPRRDFQADTSRSSATPSIGDDLGEQILNGLGASSQSTHSIPLPLSEQRGTLKKFVRVRRKQASPAIQVPAFIDTLTSLLSPDTVISDVPLPSRRAISPSPGVFGLGISHTAMGNSDFSGGNDLEQSSMQDEAARAPLDSSIIKEATVHDSEQRNSEYVIALIT